MAAVGFYVGVTVGGAGGGAAEVGDASGGGTAPCGRVATVKTPH